MATMTRTPFPSLAEMAATDEKLGSVITDLGRFEAAVQGRIEGQAEAPIKPALFARLFALVDDAADDAQTISAYAASLRGVLRQLYREQLDESPAAETRER